jgi:hypothetical protein
MTEEIDKVLVISTAHVTPKTLRIYGFEQHVEPHFRVGYHPYGFWLYAAADDELEGGDVFDDITAIRAYARSLGCRYINVDADGEVSPNLKEYDHGS